MSRMAGKYRTYLFWIQYEKCVTFSNLFFVDLTLPDLYNELTA